MDVAGTAVVSSNFLPRTGFVPDYDFLPCVRKVSRADIAEWYRWGFTEGEIALGTLPAGLAASVVFNIPKGSFIREVLRASPSRSGVMKVVLLKIATKPRSNYLLAAARDEWGRVVPVSMLSAIFDFHEEPLPAKRDLGRYAERVDCDLSQEYRFAIDEWTSRREQFLQYLHNRIDQVWSAKIARFEEALRNLKLEIRQTAVRAKAPLRPSEPFRTPPDLSSVGDNPYWPTMEDLLARRKVYRNMLLRAEAVEAKLRRAVLAQAATHRPKTEVLYTLDWSIDANF